MPEISVKSYETFFGSWTFFEGGVYRVLFGRKSRNLISYHLLYFAEFWHFNVICWLVCAWDKWCRCRGISRQIQHRITQKKSQSFFPILNWIFADSRKESFLKPLHDTLNCTAVVVTVKILHTIEASRNGAMHECDLCSGWSIRGQCPVCPLWLPDTS